MTTFEQSARAEAERVNAFADEQFNRGVEFAQGVELDSFTAGASWLAEYLLSGDFVESLYRAHVEARLGRSMTDEAHAATRSKVEVAWMRAALEAALNSKTTNHMDVPGGSE